MTKEEKFDCTDDTADFLTFAEFLVRETVYYYWANITVHSYFTKSGVLKFWYNYKGEESRACNSLKKLLDDGHMKPPTYAELLKSDQTDFTIGRINKINSYCGAW